MARARILEIACTALLVAVVAPACSAHGDEGTGTGDDEDASVPGRDGATRDVTLPLMDALAFADSDLGDGSDDGSLPGKGSCVGLADGTVCATGDPCHDPSTCVSEICVDHPRPDGTVCAAAPDACHTDGTCKSGTCGAIGKRADGYNWMAGDDTARCCGATPVHTNTSSNCGVCGIKCNAGNGESCQTLGGHWFCRGCVASAACWSGCCSQSFSPYSCAASDCMGNCKDSVCPPGSHCVVGGATSSDYCAY